MVFTMQNEGPFSEGFWKPEQGQGALGASGGNSGLLREVGGLLGQSLGCESIRMPYTLNIFGVLPIARPRAPVC